LSREGQGLFERVIGTLFGGTKHERDEKRLRPVSTRINEIYVGLRDLSEEALSGKTAEFRARLAAGETLDDLLPEAYAVVKEACRRHVGRTWKVCDIEVRWDMVPFDVQLMGASVLHEGKISEMATGEGKTLVAVMPLYLNALTGKGVHLITVNDYLARRDSEWMGQILRYLGLTVGVIQHDMPPPARRAAYACDVTYGTNNEFGFDYLRDNMAVRQEDQVQRGHHYGIVDEVDSVLVDEARTPLIISGPVQQSVQQYDAIKPAVERVTREQTKLVNSILSEVEKLAVQDGNGGNGEDAEEDEDGGEAEEAAAAPAAAPSTGRQTRGDAKRDKRAAADRDWEIGAKLLTVQRGSPKNKRLFKLYAENPAFKKLAQRVELDLIRDKRMQEIDEDLLYVIDERNHLTDLSEKGRQLMSPNDPGFFVLPDLSVELERIQNDESVDAKERVQRRDALNRSYAERADRIHCVHQLIRAYALYEKDVEYVVQDGKVLIVDEFTGRLMPGRRFSDGLHQALEAKEGVRVGDEMQTLATITLQNYFRLYSKLAGMTGTAETEAGEFYEIYKLDVVVIPTNEPVRRVDYDDVIYKTRREKYNAVIEEIAAMHEAGRPVLVGTVSVEVSETLSRLLKRRGIPHSVLNAKYHQQEAEIVASAGRPGAVTIATNMAGRGTDIKLGEGIVKGKRCVLRCDLALEECGATDSKEKCTDDMPCGLHIIGTERHEARRIDRQLRGRAGRQGDPGSSRFFLSLEDDLMRLFGSERIAAIMEKMGVEEGEVIEHPLVTRSISGAQKRVEAHNFEIRKRLLEYDNVMNQQRELVYGQRQAALAGADLKTEVIEMLDEAVAEKCEELLETTDETGDWPLRQLGEEIEVMTMHPVSVPEIEVQNQDNREAVIEHFQAEARRAYEAKEAEFTSPLMRQVERFIYLRTLDSGWRDHLHEVDQLREGIGWQSVAGKDPLIEYKKEAFKLFELLMLQIHHDTVRNLFKVSLVEEPQPAAPPPPRAAGVTAFQPAVPSAFAAGVGAGAAGGAGASRTPGTVGAGSGSLAAGGRARGAGGAQAPPVSREPVRRGPEVGRNEPCPCGSGKKYKRCHGAAG
jgi:preprotein translocase subunit SecA